MLHVKCVPEHSKRQRNHVERSEDQLIDDGDKVEKVNSSTEIPIIIDPIVPPTMNANHGKELQEGDGVTKNEDDPTIDDVEPTEQVGGELPLSPYEPPLRRSTREL